MKRFVFLFSVLAIIAGFTACNGKDVPEEVIPEEELKAGEQEIAQLKEWLLDQDGNVMFNKTNIEGLYIIGVEFEEDAVSLAGIYAGEDFKGESYTRSLSGKKGTVEVTRSQENGVFYDVLFNVETIPSFTLRIADTNYTPPAADDGIHDGDSGTYHICTICYRTWKGVSSLCPWRAKH